MHQFSPISLFAAFGSLGTLISYHADVFSRGREIGIRMNCDSLVRLRAQTKLQIEQ